jgi:predicted transcriptional regulator
LPPASRERDREMSEDKPTVEKKKLTSQILRERLGSVPQGALEISREHQKVKKRLREALKEGPKTVPEISERTQIPSRDVLWHLMSMKKYGEVIEGEEQGSYVQYALKPSEDKKQ